MNNHLAIAKELTERYDFATMEDTNEIYIYRDGVYAPHGRAFIQENAKRELGENFSTHKVNEIINWISFSTFVKRASFDRDCNTINMLNGLLNIDTLEFTEHTPSYLSLIQLPVFYYRDSQCPLIQQFFHEVLSLEGVPLVEEMFGYCLLRDYRLHKAFLLQGSGNNGKTTLLNLLQRFLGARNCSNVSLGELANDRFAPAQLFGKMANIFADLPWQALRETGIFKALVGQDRITAQRKFERPFEFTNNAKLLFSCNYVPITYDLSPAFFSRWIIIRLPNTFEGDHANANLLADLCNEEELSGLLNVAIKGLQRLLQRGFSYSKTPREVSEEYQRLSDPVAAFLSDCCEGDPDEVVVKAELYNRFKSYCKEKGYPTLSEKKFSELLKRAMPVIDVRLTLPNGERPMAWKGLRFSDNGRGVTDVNVSLHLNTKGDRNNIESKMSQNLDIVDKLDVEKQLGMSIEEALAIWRREGAPVIHLGPGEDCFDLETLLRSSYQNPKHFRVITAWLSVRSGESSVLD